jgi:hypothetical protein
MTDAADATTQQICSALCSTVYHNNDADQYIKIADLSSSFQGRDFQELNNLAVPGLKVASDGFYYSDNGFGARIVRDGGTYYVVCRGTDLGDLDGWKLLKTATSALLSGPRASDQNNRSYDTGDLVADVQAGFGQWHSDDQVHSAFSLVQALLS